jgi:uncharacterized protein
VAERAVADTSPLVAIVRKREEAHKKCVAAAKSFKPPLLTCWPVLTEAAWLLRDEPDGIRAIGGMVRNSSLRLIQLDDDALAWMIDFLARYASAGAQLADAAVMYIAEKESIDTVFTLDRRDFSIYRTTGGKALRILPEP